MNVPRIKGSHNAMLSGIAAAEAAFAALGRGPRPRRARGLRGSGALRRHRRATCKPVRNAKPLWSRFGTYIGIALGGIDMWLNTIIPGGFAFTLKHQQARLRDA